MKYFDLLCSSNISQTLDDFAAIFFKAMDNDNYEERESSNYVDGRYFIGHVLSQKTIVALIDEEGFDDLMYWIFIECKSDDALSNQLLDSIVKEKLLPLGFQVAKIENFGKKNMVRTNY